jgi:threonine-phosphate decarboxylase
VDKQNEKINSVHGGDIYSDGIFKGYELLDFSSNINPIGISNSFKGNILEGIKNAELYPDIHYRELKANLIHYLNKAYITKENIVLGNGAAEIIDLVISCFKSITIAVPSFAEYEIDAKKWGCEVKFSTRSDTMELVYDDILNKFKTTDAVIIGNPNNPDGSLIDKEKFMAIIKYAEGTGKIIIIDEAFIEFAYSGANSYISELKEYKCIFIIRALTKFFGMPVIRFGYGISKDNALISEIIRKQNPWNINCFAELAVKYVLRDEGYINKSREWIKEEINYLPKALGKISFIQKVYPTNCNFILCKLKNFNGSLLYDLCLEKGIVIRKASNFRGLDDNFVRFAIKDRDKNNKLVEALKDIEEAL